MKEIRVTGQKRTDLGKKASKQLRKGGLIPCNLYGKTQQDGRPVTFSFITPMLELRKLAYTPHIYVVELTIDSERRTIVLKEPQFHPVTDALLHVDFYEVNDQKPIIMDISVKLVGLTQGIRDGGCTNMSIRKINVKAPYQQIPEHFGVNITGFRLDKSIKVGELNSEDLGLVTPKKAVVCSIKATRNSIQAAQAATAAGVE